jgi:hypothetical protein
LTTTGTFTGGGSANMAFNLSAAAGLSSRLFSTGNSGTTTVNFTNVGGPVVAGGPTPVIVNNGGAGTGTLNAIGGAGLGNYGLVNVSLQSFGNGNWDLVRTANTAAIAAPGSSIIAALSAVDASFHQATSPFVSSPQSQEPGKWWGGVWSRASGGQVTTKATAFDGFTGMPVPMRVKTTFDAYEVGVDTGGLNINGTGWNVHYGVMAGEVHASANELVNTPATSMKFNVPFFGAYMVLTHGAFFADATYRHDWHDDSVTNAAANLGNATLHGHGNSVSSSATYHIDLQNNWFAEPSVGFGATLSEFGTLQTNANQQSLGIASGAISFDSINSLLARTGVRVGTTVPVSQSLVVQPFGTFSVWHEFDDNSRSVFTQPGFADAVTVNRVGTFYQAGVGMSGQIINTGWLGFVRGDFRWGDRIDGTSIIGGLRYNFAQ